MAKRDASVVRLQTVTYSSFPFYFLSLELSRHALEDLIRKMHSQVHHTTFQGGLYLWVVFCYCHT